MGGDVPNGEHEVETGRVEGEDSECDGNGGPYSMLEEACVFFREVGDQKDSQVASLFLCFFTWCEADTSTSVDLVISNAAVNMSSQMNLWLLGSCTSLLKGWARSLLLWSCSHSAARLVSICV